MTVGTSHANASPTFQYIKLSFHVKGSERTMVFVETKRQADFIATFLCQEKVNTTSIHG